MARDRAAPELDIQLLCPGQGCKEREQCLRYKIRRSTCEWASFDLERLHFPKEPCPVYVDNWMRRKAVAGR